LKSAWIDQPEERDKNSDHEIFGSKAKRLQNLSNSKNLHLKIDNSIKKRELQNEEPMSGSSGLVVKFD
jgi:hypothetical protein